jgi:hypothetical protein
MAATEQATEAQLGFIQSLVRERDTDRLTELQRTWLDTKLSQTVLNRGQASRIISALKKLPKIEQAVNITTHGVPNGRYAVEHGGTLKFFRVNTPTEGKWAGMTFVDVQASDELHGIRDRKYRNEVLVAIARDPKAAMLRYGQELGHCGHCGRTLTNELSREIGIGPICRGKMGW